MKRLYKWMLAPLFLVLFFSCDKDNWKGSPAIEKDFNFTGFMKVSASTMFNVIITKGENFSIKAKGPANDVNDITMYIDNNALNMKFLTNVQGRPHVDVVITMPTLVTTTLAANAHGTLNGFQGQDLGFRIFLSGASKCTVNGAGDDTRIELLSASEITINGTTESLIGYAAGASKVFSYGLASTAVDISTANGSIAYVKPQNLLYADASTGSRIYYKGAPGEKHIETSEGGQVIQE